MKHYLTGCQLKEIGKRKKGSKRGEYFVLAGIEFIGSCVEMEKRQGRSSRVATRYRAIAKFWRETGPTFESNDVVLPEHAAQCYETATILVQHALDMSCGYNNLPQCRKYYNELLNSASQSAPGNSESAHASAVKAKCSSQRAQTTTSKSLGDEISPRPLSNPPGSGQATSAHGTQQEQLERARDVLKLIDTLEMVRERDEYMAKLLKLRPVTSKESSASLSTPLEMMESFGQPFGCRTGGPSPLDRITNLVKRNREHFKNSSAILKKVDIVSSKPTSG